MKNKIIIALILGVIAVSSTVVNGANLNIRARIPESTPVVPPPAEVCKANCNQDCSFCNCTGDLQCINVPSVGNVCRNPLATTSPTCVVGETVILNIHVTPEKRKPYDNPNLSLKGKMQIKEAGKTDTLVNFDFQSSPTGWMQAEVPASVFPALPGNFDFYIKGSSYLNKILPNIKIENKTSKEIDGINQIDTDAFQTYYYRSSYPDEPSCPYPGEPCISSDNALLAGDVQFQKDNFVNGLDFGAMEGQIYDLGDNEADLDYNEQINGLDFSIAEFNIYKRGQ